MKPAGVFHARLVPPAITEATNPSWFCHRIVFPSADSFVTVEEVPLIRMYSDPELSVAICVPVLGGYDSN